MSAPLSATITSMVRVSPIAVAGGLQGCARDVPVPEPDDVAIALAREVAPLTPARPSLARGGLERT